MKPKVIKQAVSEIEKAIKKSGYENTFDFHKKSGIGVSYFTIVRLLDPAYPKAPSISTLIEVAYYAGLKPAEIKQILISIGDPFWHKLIAEGEELSIRESALIETARAINSKSDSFWGQIANSMKLIAQAAGVASKCEKQLQQLGA